MRLVYISNSTIPSTIANSVHVMKMSQALVANGHEVLLCAPNDKAGEEPLGDFHDPYDFYGVKPCFKIRKLPWPKLKGRRGIYGLLAAVTAKFWHPDLVYGRFVPGVFFSAAAGLNVILETHAPVEEQGKLCHWMFARLIINKRLKRIVVISNALKQYYQHKYDLPADLIIVACDGADQPDQHEKIPLGRPGHLQVGYVGHLYPGRGIQTILELARSCSWADFHLIGGIESDVDYWKDMAKDISNITFHGFVPHRQTDVYRNSFDVLIAPYEQHVFSSTNKGTDTAKYMSPLKIFEYMAAGKPIICSDLPVLREILTDQNTALLCQADNLSSWAQCLERLENNPGLREQLGQAARKDFLAKYTWKARAQKVLMNVS